MSEEQSDEKYELHGPRYKDAEHYLKPQDWVGEPVPADKIGPYGLGQTCWFYYVENRETGGRKGFAAETPERALEAAHAWLAEQGDKDQQ